jgi:hypothetical protein
MACRNQAGERPKPAVSPDQAIPARLPLKTLEAEFIPFADLLHPIAAILSPTYTKVTISAANLTYADIFIDNRL